METPDIKYIPQVFDTRKIEANKPYFLIIKDTSRNHYYASKVVFKNDRNVELTIVDSLSDATKTSGVETIAKTLANSASKLN